MRVWLLVRYYKITPKEVGKLTLNQMKSALKHIAEIENLFNGKSTAPEHKSGPKEALKAAKALSHMGKMKRPKGI